MTLDKEDQRLFLLEMISKVSIPGQVLDFVYELKQAIQNAPVHSGDGSMKE